VHVLYVVADMLVAEEKLNYLVPQYDLSQVRRRLFEPFFEKARAYLSSCLVQQTEQASCLAGDSCFDPALLREDIERFQGSDI